MRYLTSKLISCTFIIIMIAVGWNQVSAAPTQSLRSGGYFCGTDGTCKWFKPSEPDWLFERFTYAMGYADCAADIETWRTKSPGSILTLYTTGTDMPAYKSYTSNSYLFGRKSTYVRDRMVELGDIEENAYMHFYDDTWIRNWNGSGYDSIMIPGTHSMNIDDGDSASRVINSYTNYLFHSGVTYNSDVRLSPNFANTNLRQAYKEFITQAFNEQVTEHWPNATGTWDGLYFDNYSPYSMASGNLAAGGHIVETGTSPDNLMVLGTDPYRDWTWELMKTFGREVRDTLQMGDQWAIDGRKKFLCYNVGLSYRDEYLYPEVSGADALNFEFGFDPVYSNNQSYYRLENIHTRDSAAAANGATFFWTSRPRTSYGNGSTSTSQAIYDNLCFYYVARSDSSWIFMRPETGNAYGVFLNPGFDTLAWIPAMGYDLGLPVGHYQMVTSGASPDESGATYKIWVREYENGMVYMRPRDGFDARWGENSTPISVQLPGSYRPLQADGSLAEPVSSISLAGAEGLILISEAGSSFAATPREGELPLTVNFTAQSAEPATGWQWDFGDGAASTEQNPQHTYTQPGLYSVRLIILQGSGADTLVKNDYIDVWQPPTSLFSASPTEGSNPLIVTFADLSEGSPTSWQWIFGDGTVSSEQNPQHTYAEPGLFAVTLIATRGYNADTLVKNDYINVWQPPTAMFAATPTEGDDPLTVSFADLSQGDPTAWQWNFGDGHTSTERHPNHVYATPGVYSVSLTVANSHYQDDTTAVNLIDVQQYSADVACIQAGSDLPYYSQVTGDYSNTYDSDNVYEVIREVLTGAGSSRQGSYLDHRWRFDIGEAQGLSISVEAYRPMNRDRDDFRFEYSTNNVSFIPLLVVNSGTERVYQADLPSGVSGVVYVRVVDTDRHFRRSSLDPVYIDYMCIEAGGEPLPPDTIFVSDVQISHNGGHGWKQRAKAAVSVVSAGGVPVEGVQVWGHFSGPSYEVVSAMTDDGGNAILLSSRQRGSSVSWCFMVDTLISEGDIYDPTLNLQFSACEVQSFKSEVLPLTFDLGQNYPNPFNPTTAIPFSLPQASAVSLEVFNIRGQRVAVLTDGYFAAGYHRVDWDAGDQSIATVASGIYFYRMTAGDMVMVRKMLLMK